ncbi:hypothetical protein [Streptococcus suis]
MKKLFKNLIIIGNLSTIFLYAFYALLGIIIGVLASLIRPKGKAITLLKSIDYLDLFYSARFLLLVTIIIGGSLFILTFLLNKEFIKFKYARQLLILAKHVLHIWLVISFSLLLLNSFKPEVYNFITVIIATAALIWKPAQKLSEKVLSLFNFLIQHPKRTRDKNNKNYNTEKQLTVGKRVAPKFPPKRFSRHKRQ